MPKNEICPLIKNELAQCYPACPSWRGVRRDNKPTCSQGYSVQPGEGCLPWYKQQVRVLQTEVKEHEKYAKKKNKEHGLLVDRIEQLEAQLKSAQAGSYT